MPPIFVSGQEADSPQRKEPFANLPNHNDRQYGRYQQQQQQHHPPHHHHQHHQHQPQQPQHYYNGSSMAPNDLTSNYAAFGRRSPRQHAPERHHYYDNHGESFKKLTRIASPGAMYHHPSGLDFDPSSNGSRTAAQQQYRSAQSYAQQYHDQYQSSAYLSRSRQKQDNPETYMNLFNYQLDYVEKVRRGVSSQTTEALEEIFLRNPHPDLIQIKAYGRMFQEDEKKIRIWFKNRRGKQRKLSSGGIDQQQHSELAGYKFNTIHSAADSHKISPAKDADDYHDRMLSATRPTTRPIPIVDAKHKISVSHLLTNNDDSFGGYDDGLLDSENSSASHALMMMPSSSPTMSECHERVRSAPQECPRQTGLPRINVPSSTQSFSLPKISLSNICERREEKDAARHGRHVHSSPMMTMSIDALSNAAEHAMTAASLNSRHTWVQFALDQVRRYAERNAVHAGCGEIVVHTRTDKQEFEMLRDEMTLLSDSFADLCKTQRYNYGPCWSIDGEGIEHTLKLSTGVMCAQGPYLVPVNIQTLSKYCI